MIVVDAGPLIALLDRNESSHIACRTVLSGSTEIMLTTWPCFTEAMYLLQRAGGYLFEQALWRLWLAGRLQIHNFSDAEIHRMEELMQQFRDTPMDLADASLVALAETLSLQRIFTLDSHFYVYRTADGHGFELVP